MKSPPFIFVWLNELSQIYFHEIDKEIEHYCNRSICSCLITERIQRWDIEVKRTKMKDLLSNSTLSGGERTVSGEQLSWVSLTSWLCAVWKWIGRIFIEEGGVWGRISWFSSQFHLPKGRRDFRPYLALIRSVMASVHDGYFLSARLILL